MKFVRKPKRIYTIMDFEDGEEIEFAYYPDKPNAVARGLEIWRSKVDGRTMLLSPDDLAYCKDLYEQGYRKFSKSELDKQIQELTLKSMDLRIHQHFDKEFAKMIMRKEDEGK